MDFYENTAQEEAISAINGPVCIIACPGSGKSTTMIRRANRMVTQEGIPASRILMTTFSNMAAKDMEEKYRKMYGENPGILFATLHSLSFNILRNAGLYDTRDIIKESDKMEMLFQFLKHQEKVDNAWDLASKVETDITVVKSNMIEPSLYSPESINKDSFIRIYEAYEAWKQEKHGIDFDDMLLYAYEALRDRPEVLGYWQDRFTHFVCDEYQDTNYVQRDILYLLSGRTRNLCVVGDDDQSIYRFRGARSEIMLGFGKDFPDCRFIRMGTNYRSGKKIVTFSDALIAKNKNRFTKEFISWRGRDGFEGDVTYTKNESRDEAFKKILKTVKEAKDKGIPYKDMAILLRTNEQAGKPVEVFARNDIPFYCTETIKSKYEGFIFLDLKSYVLLSAGLGNNNDLLRILNHPTRYFKERNFNHAEYSLQGLLQAASYIPKDPDWKYQAAQQKIRDWMTYFGPGVINMSDAPEKAFKHLSRLGYRAYIKSYAEYRNLDEDEFVEQLKALKEEAKKFNTIKEWFEYAEQDVFTIQERNKQKDKNGVCITTFHKAKGKEWPIVFVVDVVKDLVPFKKAKLPDEIEEERRCFYVACTRARDALYISTSGRDESPFMVNMKKSLGIKECKGFRPEDMEFEELYCLYHEKSEKAGVGIRFRNNPDEARVIYVKDRKYEKVIIMPWREFTDDVYAGHLTIKGKLSELIQTQNAE